jgi:predicted ABC-type transport system involved in lysophospholipase L1 biosynthesis ATPase subunit
LRGVSLATPGGAVRDFSLARGPGELALVGLAEGERSPLPDLCLGLEPPAEGSVLAFGRDWAATGPDGAAALRRRIGTVLDRTAWLSNLDLDENVLLAAIHHRRGTPAALRARAGEWSRRFGLPGLPDARPAWSGARTSRIAQWVRAFLCEPGLLLAERPTLGLGPEDRRRWADAVAEARAGGAAVLWLTADPAVWDNDEVRPTFVASSAGGPARRRAPPAQEGGRT